MMVNRFRAFENLSNALNQDMLANMNEKGAIVDASCHTQAASTACVPQM
jgi:hypothetical protein